MQQRIEISSKDLNNHRYRFGISHIPEELERSIVHFGILNPIKLLKSKIDSLLNFINKGIG